VRIPKQQFAEHLLNNMTWPERILWSRLKRKQLVYSFQRQAVVLGFIVDFWCYEARVAIEIDGAVHELKDQRAWDERKNAAFAGSRYELLRFTNEDVRYGIGAVLMRIWEACDRRAPFPAVRLRRTAAVDAVDNSDFAGVIQLQQAKQLQAHADRFFRGFWKNQPLRCGWPIREHKK
jgi:very-short-patch-repair endonuclease